MEEEGNIISLITRNEQTNNDIGIISSIGGNINNNLDDNNRNTESLLNKCNYINEEYNEIFYDISENHKYLFQNYPSNQITINQEIIHNNNTTDMNKTKENTCEHNIDKAFSYYIETLHKHNLTIVPLIGDGNCLFRAFAHQLYGNEDLHNIIRQKCMDYMEQNASFYSHFIADSTFTDYIIERRKEGVWGDHLEIKV